MGVLIKGCDIAGMELSKIGAEVGYLFQNPDKQIFATTVKDELSFVMRMNKQNEDEIKETVSKVSHQFHIAHLMDAKCHRLSKGEKQRVALAGIFMRNPEFLILDEPTTGLDDKRKLILGEVLEDVKKQGVGIMLITHDKDFVACHADRVLIIEDNKVLES